MRNEELAVLFTDIGGISSLCGCMSPEMLVEILEAYYNAVNEVVVKSHGVLNKYIGDRVMVTFNVPAAVNQC